MRKRKRERERKAQHAVDDLSGPFLAFEQLDHLHSLSQFSKLPVLFFARVFPDRLFLSARLQ